MSARIITGDALTELRKLPNESVHCCVTSPPYWGLRDYGTTGQLGLEPTIAEYITNMVAVFREVRRVLRSDGTAWVNMGDSYNAYNGGAGPSSNISAGASTTQRPQLETGYGLRSPMLKPKDLCGIPWRLAFALQADGWWLRQDIIWSKPNPMPESVTDRCTKAHEYIFLLSKSERYYYDADAIAEPQISIPHAPGNLTRDTGFGQNFGDGRESSVWASDGTRNKRSVWTVATQPYSEAHFATFPPDLIKPCILAGCPIGGIVLDPFGGAGTTALVADRRQRHSILIELNPKYADMARHRLHSDDPLFVEITA